MTTEITITQALDRLVAIQKASIKNAETALRYTQILQKHVAELEAENKRLKGRGKRIGSE